ncbi:hypothetical protein [Glutamicibacter sp. ZJUTW]|uniref:hypothetical protein n=1 Tax=Glutamicibacter sp. ZJUTW TaxID=1155384 RepID=UPI00143D2CF2|nr:hypothetical protein [Glutamicibacter sp. ZJUTW]
MSLSIYFLECHVVIGPAGAGSGCADYLQIGIVQPTETFQVFRGFLVGESSESRGLLIT